MDSLENIVQLFIQKGMSQKGMASFEVYAEYRDTAFLTSVLDSRSRWMGEIDKKSEQRIDLFCLVCTKEEQEAFTKITWEAGFDIDGMWRNLVQQAQKNNKKTKIYRHSEGHTIRNAGLEIWDPRYPNITDEDRREVIDWNMEVIKQASSRAKGKIFRLEETQMNRMFFSSDGRRFEEKSTHFSLFGEVELQVRPPRRLSELHTSRHFADVASRPISMGIVRSLDTGERLTSNLEENYIVVFEAKVVAELFKAILGCFSYEKIRDKESFLHRYIGQRIGSQKLHVIDDASLPNGVNTRAFDARGIAPIARTLICEGFVRDFYVSIDDAALTEMKPTGHLGFDNSLWPGNLIIKAGRRSLNMILTPTDVAIFCTHLLAPVHFDETTGEIELLLGCSLLREEKRRRLHGVRIKKHIVQIFDAIDEVASTQRRIDSVDASDWVLKNLKVEFLQDELEGSEE